VLVAFFLAQIFVGNTSTHAEIEWVRLAGAFFTASLLYVGGCFLGDFHDLAFDIKNRPNRPLPQGTLSPTRVHVAAWLLIVLALAATSVFPKSIPMAGILTITLVTYAVFHKKNRAIALMLMGSCRALLILYSFSITGLPLGPLALTFAISVGAYTVFLSSVAATENTTQQISFRKPLFIAMAVIPLIFGCFILHSITPAFAMFLVIYLAWIIAAFEILPQSKPDFVSRALAGFCLLDACFATAYSPVLSLICLLLWVGALALQRVAPAT